MQKYTLTWSWFWHILHASLSSQERISQLEEDLNEEHCSGDRLMERLDKTKVQAGVLPHYLCFFVFSYAKSHFVFAGIYKISQLWRDRIMPRLKFEHPALRLFLS